MQGQKEHSGLPHEHRNLPTLATKPKRKTDLTQFVTKPNKWQFSHTAHKLAHIHMQTLLANTWEKKKKKYPVIRTKAKFLL